VAVATSHFVGCVTNEFINDSLVHALASQVADEAMAQAVPAFDFVPLRTTERRFKMTMGLISCEWRGPLPIAARHRAWMAKGERATRMIVVEPITDDSFQSSGQGNTSSSSDAADPFSFADGYDTSVEVEISGKGTE